MPIPDVVQKVVDHVATEIQVYPCHRNRSYNAGHPCERFLVYSRLNWAEKLRHDVGLQFIFNEGHVHEPAVLKLLRESGWEIVQQSRPYEWQRYELTGKIDAMLSVDGKLFPFDVKSISPWNFDSIETLEDLRNHKEYYVRGYYYQMLFYLLMSEEPEGFLLFKNKQSGRLRQINVTLDYEEGEKALQKLERINIHVAAKTYPDRIDDRDVCRGCSFRHICLPDEDFDSIKIIDDEEILLRLNAMEENKVGRGVYNNCYEEIKEQFRARGTGVYMIGGAWTVDVRIGEKMTLKIERIKDNGNTA